MPVIWRLGLKLIRINLDNRYFTKPVSTGFFCGLQGENHRDIAAEMRNTETVFAMRHSFIKAVVGRIIKLLERINLQAVSDQAV